VVQPSEIMWGSYRMYEGPFWPGRSTPFVLPEVPTEEDKILAVVCACEGGSYSAINMYDGSPILSSGLIQFIEGRGIYAVSQMIGHSFQTTSYLGKEGLREHPFAWPFFEFLAERNLDFLCSNKWHFFTGRGVDKVDTAKEQNQIFRNGSTGEKGTWDTVGIAEAKNWAAAVASIWEHPEAQRAQREFTIPKLKQFCFGGSRRWVVLSEEYGGRVAEAFVAAYISFAVNNPTRANKHLSIALERLSKKAAWTQEWLIEILKELTFGPKIAIYPHRYNAIRPALEKLYGVDLPDFAEELERWKEETGLVVISTEELQKALLSLGADIGPCGADGKYGKKTRDALLSFELTHGVPREHCDGMLDEFTAPALEKALLEAGVALLGESS
jgi:hypothetical protein